MTYVADQKEAPEYFFVSVSGPDRPGITSTLAGVLASFDAKVLDIDQAVIHEHLAWGMLVQMPPGRRDALLKELLFVTHELGLELSQQPISAAAFEDWVRGGGRRRSIVTLLGPELTAHQLAAVTDLIRSHRHNINAINRISHRAAVASLGDSVAPKRPDASSRTHDIFAIEIQTTGDGEDLNALRSSCLALSVSLGLDIAVQQQSVWRRNRRLVCFDMDSTLIENEVIDLLAEVAGVRDRVAVITERAMNGELDFAESFTERLALLAGLEATVLDRVAADIKLSDGAERLMLNLRKLGLKTAILSGGFEYFAKPLAAKLGVDDVHANRFEIKDGSLTGRHLGPIVDARRKVTLLREMARAQGINLEQVIAVGDGANDVPMLSAAGLGIAFRAKQIVRRQANYSVGTVGLDAILYLIGMREDEIVNGPED